MRLPDIDPAGSPRVAMNAPRVDHNPYVPRMGVPAKRYAGIPPAGSVAAPSPRAQHTKTVPPGAGGGHQDFDQAGPYQPHMPSGSQSARTHAEEQNARSKSASASLGTTPRQQQLNAQKDAHEAQQARKRLERLQDAYQTALSRETLLSEGYDKELVSLRENLQKVATNQPVDRAQAEFAAQGRKRAKLQRRVAGFEEKLNELGTYNAKLVDMISALRKQNEPNRNAEKRVTQALEKLNADMATQKAACHKALDERERMLDLLRHLHDDAARDENVFINEVENLKRESEELDRENKQVESVLAQATELAKRKQFKEQFSARKQQERLQCQFAYLKSQLDGVDNDFRELQRIVGVHFQPEHPESLELIIKKFVEKEGQVVSLQRYFSLQSDEIESLDKQLLHLNRDLDAATAAERAAQAAEDAKANSRGKDAPWDGPALDQLQQNFDKACALLEGMFLHTGCDTADAAGMTLTTKGCSMSTFHDFLSCLAQRIDSLSSSAAQIREAASAHRNTNKKSESSVLIEAFLRPRGAGSGPPPLPSPPVVGSGAKMRAMRKTFEKEELPSMTEYAPEDFADGLEPADARRRREKEAKRGAIDREKRDSAISSWVARQQQVRGAQTARPSIREYYEESPRPNKPIYPPASAR